MTGSPWRENFDRLFPGGITVRPTTIRGTCYFVDRVAVVREYRALHPDMTIEELAILLEEREQNGEIQIGRPPVGGDEVLVTLPNGRWGSSQQIGVEKADGRS